MSFINNYPAWVFVGNNAVVPKATVNNMIDIKLNKMENKRKKYVSPTVEELGFESEVHLLTISQGTTSTLQSMEKNNTFDNSGSSARENGYDFVFDEE